MSLKKRKTKTKITRVACFLTKDHVILFSELFFFHLKKLFIHIHETGNLKARVLKSIVIWSVMELKNGQSYIKAKMVHYNTTYGNLQVRNIAQKCLKLFLKIVQLYIKSFNWNVRNNNKKPKSLVFNLLLIINTALPRYSVSNETNVY